VGVDHLVMKRPGTSPYAVNFHLQRAPAQPTPLPGLARRLSKIFRPAYYLLVAVRWLRIQLYYSKRIIIIIIN
jgi:hypothetical protein